MRQGSQTPVTGTDSTVRPQFHSEPPCQAVVKILTVPVEPVHKYGKIGIQQCVAEVVNKRVLS